MLRLFYRPVNPAVAIPEKPHKRSLSWHLQQFDYAWVLPWIGSLPPGLGRWASQLRARINARFSRDWAELSLGLPYITERTRVAAAELWPAMNAGQIVLERYKQTALEEWHGAMLQKKQLDALPLDLSNLKQMLAKKERQRGLVVLTAHFDSFIVGMLGLGLCGQKTWVTTSNVYKNALVHPAVQTFFDQKYLAGNAFLNSGQFTHVETSTRNLMKALARGETLAVVADAPASPDGSGVWLDWLGRPRKLADGAIRMANKTASQLCAMVCLTGQDGTVRWLCSDVYDPQLDPDAGAHCFAHLQQCILANPGRWWAAHLLNDFPIRSATHG